MFNVNLIKDKTQEEKYKLMLFSLKGQLDSETDALANLSNAAALAYAFAEQLNWAGFYFMKEGELVLGPFQGLPACNRIQVGKGVCGAAVVTKEIQLVPDVHLFPGHIACDGASNSELVIPIVKEGRVYGVLDLDSPVKNRFTEMEKQYFSEFVEILNQSIDWERIL